MYDKKSITEQMRDGGTYIVNFIKVTTGELRTMICTINFDWVQKNSTTYVAPKGIRKVPDTQMIVWDLEKDAYRSFRPDTIIEGGFQKISDSIIINYNPKIGMDLNTLLYQLSISDMMIKFLKADETLREMNCTRSIGKYPKINGPVFKVYDIDKDDYRNINFNRILSVGPATKKHKGTTRRLLDKVKNSIKRLITKFRK